MTIVNARDTGNPVSQTFLDACVELGDPLVEDFNATAFGCGWHHLDMRDGRRGGALTSYLLPAVARGNVTLKTHTRATKLLIESGRCTGIEYLENGQTVTAHAGREVIVAAGAMETPKLLLLWGLVRPTSCSSTASPSSTNCPASARTSMTTRCSSDRSAG